jgi:RPA family protein
VSSSDDQGGPGNREVAYRLFAAEFDDADFSYSESDEERAPNYVVTPTGARVNRLFVAGVLTEIETVSEDYLRARIVDPTGPFVVYAGQYQPDALAFLEQADPPAFVAVTGKARTYQPEDSNQVYTSVRPESISEADASTRDRWVVQTAERTIDRVARTAEAKQSGHTGEDLRAALTAHGVDESLAAGIPIALEHYGTSGDYLAAVRDLALDAARVVADERDEVQPLTLGPDQGEDDVAALVETTIEAAVEASDDDHSTEETTATASADDQRAGTAESSTGTDQSTSESAADAVTDSGAAPSETGARTEETTDTDETGAASESTAHGSDGTESVAATSGTDSSTGTSSSGATTANSTDSTASDTDSDTSDDDLGDFDPEFELDEDEREEIESEYGTDFQSGTEVDEPGEAGIETPDPDEVTDETTPDADPASSDSTTDESATAEDAATDTGSASPAGSATDIGSASDVASTEATESSYGDEESPAVAESDDEPEDVDIDDAVIDAMNELDDGDGADRETVIEAVVDRTGSDRGAVEDAIQDALMGGQCYEPSDGTLKTI